MTSRSALIAIRGRILLSIVGLLLFVPTWADDWVMPGLTAQWIAQHMSLNGVPASMRIVTGDRSLDEVVQYYRQKWVGEIDERSDGEWRVLATMQGDQFVTLRLRQSGNGVRGVLSASQNPRDLKPSLASSIPVPPGLTRLTHQAFHDRGSNGENLTLMSHRSVAYERQAFASIYDGDGWSRGEDRATQTVPDGHVMQFLRGKEQVRIVLYRDPSLADGRTLILVTAHRD